MGDVPTHRNEQTGNATLDRIQSNVRALIAYVSGLAWLTNRAYSALAADTTVAAGSYATVARASITTDVGYLVIVASASGQKTTASGSNYIEVVVDGVAIKGAYASTTLALPAWNLALVVRTAVAKGSHVVELKWRTDVNSSRINAATVNEEHAHIYVSAEAT